MSAISLRGNPDGRFELDRAALHSSLGDPVIESMGFLNEVMTRYPEAISFAPGAPYPGHLDEIEIGRLIERYERHLVAERGLDPTRARRLLYEYGPSRGHINELVASALRTDGAAAAVAEAVVITVGCQEALFLTVRALCATPQDLLAVADPCYVGAVGAARLLGVGIVPVAEHPDGLDLDGLAARCRAARERGRRIRALYVAPDFANPSGTVLGVEARRRLLDLAEREDFLVLEDNPYGFTAAAEDSVATLRSLDRRGRVVYLGTFAKICLPGARVGFVLADQRIGGTGRLLADEIAVLKSMVTVNTSPLCQAVVAGMILEHGGSLAAVGRSKAPRYRENLRVLLAELERRLPLGVSWNRPAGGFFVRLRLPVPADDALLEKSAGEYGVLWTPMSKFYVAEGGEYELRLSCSYLDPDRIAEGVRRLGRLLREVCPGPG